MEDWRADRIAAAERGANPMVLARMRSGFAVIGDTQFLPGYCVLLAAPRVEGLNDLTLDERADFLLDMTLLGDAIAAVCAPIVRLNYAILGNTDTYLHAHVFPRYAWEDPERLVWPPFNYPPEVWTSPEHAYSEDRHGDLRARLTEMLLQLMAANDENVSADVAE